MKNERELIMQATKFEKGNFFLDVTSGASFEGYTSGELWNGFACPYFPFESALHIVHILSGDQTAYYDELTDEFVFDNGEEEERYNGLILAGLKLYSIGTGSWMWERLTLVSSHDEAY